MLDARPGVRVKVANVHPDNMLQLLSEKGELVPLVERAQVKSAAQAAAKKGSKSQQQQQQQQQQQ